MINENKEKFEKNDDLIGDIKDGITENRDDLMLQEHDLKRIEKEINEASAVDPEILIEDELSEDNAKKVEKNSDKRFNVLQNFSDEKLEKMRVDMVDGIKKHDGKWWNETTKNLANDAVPFIPFAGPSVQIFDAIRGKEVISGKKLENKERAWKAVEGTLFLTLDCYTCGLGGDVAKGSAKAITRTAAYMRTLGVPRSVSKTIFKTGKFIAKNPKLLLVTDKALNAVSSARKTGKLKDKLSGTVNETLLMKAEIDLKKESDPNFKLEVENFEKHERDVEEAYKKQEKLKKEGILGEVIKGE